MTRHGQTRPDMPCHAMPCHSDEVLLPQKYSEHGVVVDDFPVGTRLESGFDALAAQAEFVHLRRGKTADGQRQELSVSLFVMLKLILLIDSN
jgi:hypothetical protein